MGNDGNTANASKWQAAGPILSQGKQDTLTVPAGDVVTVIEELAKEPAMLLVVWVDKAVKMFSTLERA
jgi:hypothetical protein